MFEAGTTKKEKKERKKKMRGDRGNVRKEPFKGMTRDN